MSIDNVQEDVPGVIRRVGDQVTQGSNNTLIILGTDRAKKGPATIDDGYGSANSSDKGTGAGAIYIGVGRKDKDGNPDLSKDDAILYLSMKTDIDKNLGSESLDKDAGKAAGAILKSDNIRIACRNNTKIFFDGGKSFLTLNKDFIQLNVNDTKITIAQDGTIVLDSKKIQLGTNSSVGATLTDILITKLNQALTLLKTHTHPTSMGPAGPSTDLSSLQTINLSDVSSKRTFVDKG